MIVPSAGSTGNIRVGVCIAFWVPVSQAVRSALMRKIGRRKMEKPELGLGDGYSETKAVLFLFEIETPFQKGNQYAGCR